MAQIVLVHGIGQTQRGAIKLEEEWGPAIADGVIRAGRADIGRSLWPPSDQSRIRMAFYGDLFLKPGAQGTGGTIDTGPGGEELEAELALAWLAAAAQRAKDPRDAGEATVYLNAAAHTGEAQGARALGRTPLQTLSKIRWLAVGGFQLAGTFINRALRETSAYITRPDIRAAAQQRVLDLIHTDTRLVIAHSLGSVVAYEALHRADQPVALITLGSPLGLRTIIYDRLQPTPATVPSCVTAWSDYADIDDLVAADVDLAPLFEPAPGSKIRPVSDTSPDNGSKPHEASHYLVKARIGSTIAAALDPVA
jgi:hypothetical protein